MKGKTGRCALFSGLECYCPLTTRVRLNTRIPDSNLNDAHSSGTPDVTPSLLAISDIRLAIRHLFFNCVHRSIYNVTISWLVIVEQVTFWRQVYVHTPSTGTHDTYAQLSWMLSRHIHVFNKITYLYCTCTWIILFWGKIMSIFDRIVCPKY